MAAGGATSARADARSLVVVNGNVEGSIQAGDHNIQVNNNHGSVVFNRIEAVRRRRAAVPAPRPPKPFIGRSAERQRLRDAIAVAVATRESLGALVAGGEGAGRSSLLKQVAVDAARPGGVLVAQGLGEDAAPLTPDDIAQRLFDLAWQTEPREKVTVESAAIELQDVDAIAVVYDAALRDDDILRLANVLPRGATLLSTRAVAYGADVVAVEIGRLPRQDGIELLAARADIAIQSDPGALDSMCALLGDWAGAIAIAGRAIAIRGLAPADALTEIAAIKPAADFEMAAEYERAFALAEPALDPNARMILGAAANLPGTTVDPAILRRVLGDPPWFHDAAASLQQLGLLRLNSPRFRVAAGLRPLVRTGTRDRQVLRDAYLAAVLADLAERPDDPALIEAELGGLIEALAQAGDLALDRATAVLRAINPHLVLHGLWGLAETAHSTLARFGQALGFHDLGWTQHELGTLALASGRRREARELLHRALAIRTEIGDTEGEAYTQHNLDVLDPPPPPIDDDTDGRGPDGGGTGVRRLVTAGAVAAVAVLTIATTAVVGGFFGGISEPTPSPGATVAEASPAPTEVQPAESPSPTPRRSQEPVRTPEPTRPPPPLGDFTVDPQLDFNFSWDGWVATVTLTASGGSEPYEFRLEGFDPVSANPATFKIPGEGCTEVPVSGSVTSTGFNPEPVALTLLPAACGSPPAPPVPNDPVGLCKPITLSWKDGGGGPAERRYDLDVPDVFESPLAVDDLSYTGDFTCGARYSWTIEAVDILGQRSGPVAGPPLGYIIY